MTGLDIQSLYQFHPAGYQCKKCLALYSSVLPVFVDRKEKRAACPVCGVEYLPTQDFPCWKIDEYLDHEGFSIKFADLLDHCQRLASAAQLLGKNVFNLPPLTALFTAFNEAEHFIHFTTFGLSFVLIGALKVVAQRIQVRGIAYDVTGDTLAELTEYANDAPPGHFNIKIPGPELGGSMMPQRMLIVIDGLLAFKGSATLIVSEWRTIAQQPGVEAITDVDEVIRFHNRYFSPIWAQLSPHGKRIEMRSFPI